MRTLAVLTLLLAPAACTSYEPAPLDPAAMAREPRTLEWEAERTRIALERLEKTRLFPADEVLFAPDDGLTFREAFVAALALSPLLEQHREEIKGRESMLLAVSGIGGVKFGANDDGPSDARRGMLRLMFDPISLFGGGKVPAAHDRAAAEIDRSIARLHEAEWNLHLALKTGFLRVDRIDATRRAVDALRKEFESTILAIATPLHDLGRLPDADWNMVRNVEDLLAVRLEELNREHETAVNRLKETIGLRPEDPVIFTASGVPAPDLRWDEARLRASAIERRWDLQILLAEYLVREQTLRYEVASQYPDILIGPMFRFGNGDEVFGGALELNIPDPWASSARIDAATAERARIRHRIEEKLLTLQHEIRNSNLALVQKTSAASTWKDRTLPRVRQTSDIALTTVRLKPDSLPAAVSRFRDLLRTTEAAWLEEQHRRDALMDLERAAGYPLTPLN